MAETGDSTRAGQFEELSARYRQALDQIRQLEAAVHELTQQRIVLEGHLAAADAEADRLRTDGTQQRAEHAEIEALKRSRLALQRELEAVRAQSHAREQTIEYLLASRSWRLTGPLRALDRRLRGRQAESTGRGLALANFPIGTGLMLASDVEGAWGDGWSGPLLRFRLKPVRSGTGLRIKGDVPQQIREGQELRLTVGDRAFARHAAAGSFEWDVPVDLEAGRAVEVRITASREWQPAADDSSPDARVLAWLVIAIELR